MQLGRLLLLLASIVLITMPLTQHLWTWDHFMHGGQDFETSVLLIVTSLCLLLVLARYGKQGVDILLTAWRLCCFITMPLLRTALAASLRATTESRPAIPLSRVYNLPLQICFIHLSELANGSLHVSHSRPVDC